MIVGGGDGGVAREVIKHPAVKTVDQAEIDGRVIEVCKEFLPTMAVGYKDPRVNVFVEDGIKFMERNKNKYDVIITDSSDPIGKSLVLEDIFARTVQKRFLCRVMFQDPLIAYSKRNISN